MPVEDWRVAQWQDYLAEGRHADMHYLEQHLEKRLNPQLLVEGAKSVVCVALNYFTEAEFPADGYTLSRYARGKDYHDVVKERLQKMLDFITDFTGKAYVGRAFCDTAPVDEHYWAWRTGLGWLGRNTQLIIPQAGSYFFIGTLILTEEIDAYDQPMPNRCGTCTRCIDACPTCALSKEKGQHKQDKLHIQLEGRASCKGHDKPAGQGEQQYDKRHIQLHLQRERACQEL